MTSITSWLAGHDVSCDDLCGQVLPATATYKGFDHG